MNDTIHMIWFIQKGECYWNSFVAYGQNFSKMSLYCFAEM